MFTELKLQSVTVLDRWGDVPVVSERNRGRQRLLWSGMTFGLVRHRFCLDPCFYVVFEAILWCLSIFPILVLFMSYLKVKFLCVWFYVIFDFSHCPNLVQI